MSEQEEWVDCEVCGGDGLVDHRCVEDTCCCLDPENEPCPACGGLGGEVVRYV